MPRLICSTSVSREELRGEDSIIKKYLQDAKKSDGRWTGYLHDENSLKEFERSLLIENVSYQTESSRRYSDPDSKARLMFSAKNGAVPIELNVPFRIVSKTSKGCMFGRERHDAQSNKDQASNPTDWTDVSPARKKRKLQDPKKKGCTATMHIKRIELFPAFKMDLPPDCTVRQQKEISKAILSRLRTALSAEDGAGVVCQPRIYISMSGSDGHCNHPSLSYAQPVNADVARKIRVLVKEGVTSANEVQKHLRFFVEDVLFAGKQKPSETCRAFYPTRQDLSTHIQSAIRKDRLGCCDQENAKKLVEEMRKRDPAANYFFRPYRAPDVTTSETLQSTSEESPETSALSPDDEVLKVMAKECDETLLYCHQTAFMKYALQEYAGEVICLDATNKMTDCALPLFLLLAKTPSGYVIVGVFIVQFETAERIAEALEVFRQWCPNLSPEFWMLDFSNAEMNAISSALCDFHREQAWERWCRKKENGITDKDTLLRLLRTLAHARSEDDFNAALECLKASNIWKSNGKLRSYVEGQWLSVKEMWASCFRDELAVTTSNETEAQNTMLKERYLKCYSGQKSLTGLLQTLKSFLSHREIHFSRENGSSFDKLSASCRNGPLMSLDSLAVTDAAALAPLEACENGAANVSGECDAIDTALLDLECREQSEIGALRAKVLAEYEKGKSLSYHCTSHDNLQKVLELLGECSSLLQEGTPSVGGLGLCG